MYYDQQAVFVQNSNLQFLFIERKVKLYLPIMYEE